MTKLCYDMEWYDFGIMKTTTDMSGAAVLRCYASRDAMKQVEISGMTGMYGVIISNA